MTVPQRPAQRFSLTNPATMTRRRFWLSLAALKASLGGLRTLAAADRWPDERAAGPFVCHADFSLDGTLHLLAEVGQLSGDLETTLGIGEPREPIHLFLFAQHATYQRYLQQYFPQVPERRALYIKQRGPGMVFAYLQDEFPVDLRHECTHALLHAYLPMVPLWLDEGLAEYFEVPADARPSGHGHLNGTRWQARLGMAPSLPRLEGISQLDAMRAGEYRAAWAWTHFMLHGPPEARRELQEFLAEIARAVPPRPLSERLARRLPDVSEQFVSHFRRWT